MSRHQRIETPEALGERYWNELLELLEHGEISASFAQRVRADMFEEAAPGETPKLRWSAWRSYLAELTGDFS